MFSINCEQFLLAKDDSAPDGVTVILVQNFTPIPVNDPRQPKPSMLQIGTMAVSIILDERQRAELHAMTAPRVEDEAGAPQPDGTGLRRCGRLQSHPSHTFETQEDPGGHLWWCDGHPPFAAGQLAAEAADVIADTGA